MTKEEKLRQTVFDIENLDFDKIKDMESFHRLTQVTGSLDKALGNNLYGIDHLGVKGIIPENRDTQGYVFFTRPALNLSTINLRRHRLFSGLLTQNPNSIHRYIRCTLDPRLMFGVDSMSIQKLTTGKAAFTQSELNQLKAAKYTQGYPKGEGPSIGGESKIVSPLVDNQQAFIPLLTNTIKSMSGWEDVVLPTFTSKEGLKREQWSIADGSVEIYNSFDIDCSFRNIKEEPLVLMFQTWIFYMAAVFEGLMNPYIDFIAENEIDYNTRIYRLVMDESKLIVKKISACGAAYPLNVPTGQFFDYDDSSKYSSNSRDITIRFKCMGAMYNDDILIKEFNDVVGIFNPGMRAMMHGESHEMARIPHGIVHMFNNRGYPYINPNTLELQWWISKQSPTYKRVKSYLKEKKTLDLNYDLN